MIGQTISHYKLLKKPGEGAPVAYLIPLGVRPLDGGEGNRH